MFSLERLRGWVGDSTGKHERCAHNTRALGIGGGWPCSSCAHGGVHIDPCEHPIGAQPEAAREVRREGRGGAKCTDRIVHIREEALCDEEAAEERAAHDWGGVETRRHRGHAREIPESGERVAPAG